jgi:quinol monooxygenase YgiN
MMRIVYRVVVKEESEQAFKSLAEEVLIPEAQKMTDCINISFFQNTANPREFIFYEQWGSENAVHQYKAQLITLLGEPRPGEEFPAAMNSMIEEDEDLL